MEYTSSEDMKFNNETPWSMNTSEIMFLLAENGIREDVTPRKVLDTHIDGSNAASQTTYNI